MSAFRSVSDIPISQYRKVRFAPEADITKNSVRLLESDNGVVYRSEFSKLQMLNFKTHLPLCIMRLITASRLRQ